MNSTLIARCLKMLYTKFRVVGIMIFQMQCKNSFNNSVNKMSAGSISKFPTALLILLVSFLPFSFSGTITIIPIFCVVYLCMCLDQEYEEIRIWGDPYVFNKLRSKSNGKKPGTWKILKKVELNTNDHENIKIVQCIPSMNSCQRTKLLKIYNR